MDERYYTIDQVAELFTVTRAAVYKWMKSGQLKYVLVGAHRRIPQSAINAFIKEGKSDEVTEDTGEQPVNKSARYLIAA
jgi:excisionase family DNA binding protein